MQHTRRPSLGSAHLVVIAILLLAPLALPAARAAKQEQEAGGWPPITPEERALTKVEQDPEADAVILVRTRTGKIVKKADDTVNAMSYHWRLKVLNDRGKRFAEVHIPAQKYSRVSNIEARTIKPDGTIVSVGADQIFEKLVSRIGGIRRTEYVFNFPAVEKGAILEYRYERYDNNLLFIDPWFFSGEEYTLKSMVSQALPGDMAYSLLRENCDAQPVISDWREGKMKGRLFTLELHTVPPYRDEEYMPPRREVSPRLEFLLTGWAGRYSEALGRQDRLFIDWPSVARYARYYYQEAMKKGQGPFKTTVEGWVQGVTDPQEKIRAILHHVQTDFAYVEYDTIVGDSRTLETITKEKNADNEEKAVLLSTALKIAGIDSFIALVSGKDAGSVNPKFYSLSQFTHDVVAVPKPDGTNQWIDPTVTYAPVGFMPSKDSGADALLLKTDQGELLKLPEKNELNTTKYSVKVTPRPDGKADLDVTAEYSGEDAVEMRDDLAPAAETARLSYLQRWVAARRPGAALKSQSIENLADAEKPLVVKMAIEAPGLVTTAEGVVLVRGCALSCQDSNPLPRGSRQYPFFLQRGSNEEETDVILPVAGMKAQDMPAPVTARSEIGTLTFSCATQEDGGARCSRQFIVRKSQVPATAQNSIRAMFDKAVEADHTTVAFQQTAGSTASGR
jgi:uncharacterized protein DUF3857/transglutaminase superfamily protein